MSHCLSIQRKSVVNKTFSVLKRMPSTNLPQMEDQVRIKVQQLQFQNMSKS